MHTEIRKNMCIRPKKIFNKKYTMNEKNGGVIPPVRDKRQLWIDTPCKQCYICKKKLAREWKMRISEDIKENPNAKVILLTFSTESLKKLAERCYPLTGYELDNQICKEAVKLFRERWRKKYGRSIRHWLITELGHGKTEHVHMHGLVWEEHYRYITNEKTGEVNKVLIKHELTDKFLKEVERIWQYGWVGKGKLDWQNGEWINYIDQRTAGYFVKYITKTDEMHQNYKQIILTSAGIGKYFLESDRSNDNKYKGAETNQMYNIDNGGVLPMPEYFRRKMYTDDEREQLTSNYLDKNIVYIAGTEFSKDIGDGEIWKMRKTLQKVNAQLGYGDGGKNYELKILENSRRREIQKSRGYLKKWNKENTEWETKMKKQR